MSRTPSSRLSAARDILVFTDKFQPGTRERVLATLPDDARDALQGGSRMGWLPIKYDHWIIDGIVGVLGREQAIACWRASVLDMIERPLLRAFASGMRRVLGDDPVRIIGLLPRAWPLLFKDFCELELEVDHATQVTLLFNNLAPELREHPNYLACWTGVTQGLFEIARVPGQVAMTVDPDFKTARARCTWVDAQHSERAL
jgi:hypothetical protein